MVLTKRFTCLFFWGMTLYGMMTTPAYAYLDPATGSAILQGLLAAIVALGITAKLYWNKILVFLGVRKESKSMETKIESEIKSPHDESKLK